MTRASRQDEDHEPERRRLLRRAVATAAGAGVVAAVGLPGSAEAAPGDSLIMGTVNEAGPRTTSISASEQTALSVQSGGGPALRLVPSKGFYPGLQYAPGTIAVDEQGDLFVGGGTAESPRNGWAWTSEWATTSVAVSPIRVLDSRDPVLRRNIVSGGLDSTGRLVPGTPIVIALDAYVRDGYALKGNVTVTGTTRSGVLWVWGSGARPEASTVNWATAGTILSNFLFTELGAYGAYRSVLTIQAGSPTHVVVDMTSLLVGHPSQVRAPQL
jgi:hypothetical protein